ncbi:MAG: H-X9-DG-CTERM domain-containing protein, partial [Armatimonadota bacterium]
IYLATKDKKPLSARSAGRGAALGFGINCLTVFALLPAILFPVFAKSRKHRDTSCASNMKQIGLALLGYTQDYDEHLPPVVSKLYAPNGNGYEQEWGVTTEVTVDGAKKSVPSIISDFVKTPHIFICPQVPKPNSGLTYLYNDLAANESQASMSGVGNSVMTAEGDDHLRNVGHARSQSSEGDLAVFLPSQDGGAARLMIGAAIGDAVLRHSGGGNYGFTDGHVKWMKPDAVFFPSRASNSSSHREGKTGRLLGPDPKGPMTFQGKVYAATFHIR